MKMKKNYFVVEIPKGSKVIGIECGTLLSYVDHEQKHILGSLDERYEHKVIGEIENKNGILVVLKRK